MRIAYLIPGCGLSGGIAVICQHANRLLRRGHDVYFISESSEDRIDWFPNQCVPVLKLSDIPNDLDALIATGWSTSFHVAKLPAGNKFYFVQSDESRFHPEGSAWFHMTNLSYMLNMNFMTEARWIQKWLLENFGQETEIIPNGIDPTLFHPAEPYVPKTRKPRILLEGAIGLPYKGMAEAFEVIQRMDVEVWCVSSYGRPKPGWKVDRFFEHVKMEDMKHIYSSCDILLKLSRVEGFPCPPMEMMACGGVCVVGSVKGYDEYIVPDHNALVVDPFDIEGAREAIRRILSDQTLREKLTKNGRETAQVWQWEPSIDRLEAYLKSVIEGNIGRKASTGRQIIDNGIVYVYHLVQTGFPIDPRDRAIQRFGKIKGVRTMVSIALRLYGWLKRSKQYLFRNYNG